MIGQTLAHYQIESKLGEGGMGVVYKARDTHLNRPVAIKVLPPDKTADPERKRRFVQEAKAASALNHPHILHIYDINTANGVDFIAMEYVEGKTLDALVGPNGLRLSETLKYAVQIADALAAAHAAGITHRDIKPSNIMVNDEGLVKILDFGLAKLSETDESDYAESTQTMRPRTQQGALIGTVAYMSPEQTEGAEVDARSDIFSFGSVLYEMITGKRPFTGASNIDLLHAVLHSQPRPLAELRPNTPPEVRIIVEKTLEKDRAERYQSTRDLVVDLKRAQRSLAIPAGEPVVKTGALKRPSRGLMAGAVALLLAVVAGIIWRLQPSQPAWNNPLANAEFTRLTNFEGSEFDAAISADGKFAAFLSDRAGPVDLWATQIGTGQFSNLTKGQWQMVGMLGQSGGVRPMAFSPDATYVAVFMRAKTLLVPIMGGSSRPLLDPGIEAVWSPDGAKLAYHELAPGDPIFIADADGSNRRQIFKDQPNRHCHHLSWSPDGRLLYFARGTPTSNEMDIWRIPSSGGEPERMTFHNAVTTYPVALDDRTLLYCATAEDGSRTVLYAMNLKRRVTRPINLGVRQYTSVAASADRTRLVVTESNPSSSLWTAPVSNGISDEAAVRRLELPTERAVRPRFGSDCLVYLSSTGGADGLWRFQPGAAAELWSGNQGGVIAAPAVSADGSRIAFCVRKQGRTRLYRIAANGANPVLLAPSLQVRGAPTWSPDGKWIVVSGEDGGRQGLFKVPADGGPVVSLLDGLYFHPLWSPDGQLILYCEPFRGGELRVRAITPEKLNVPLPDMQVYYESDPYRFVPGERTLVVLRGGGAGEDQNFWVLELATGHQRQITKLRRRAWVQSFDVSPDGKAITFDRTLGNADIVLIERPGR
jgi:Tol biopolymer transport system component/predicted Ser/Thr protein kinase